MNKDSKRDENIKRYFGMLQGLKAIPFGLLLFALAAQDLGNTLLGEPGNCSVTLPLFLFVLALLFAIDQYYLKLFGRVKAPSRRTQLQETTVFLTLFALVIILENYLAPPFSLMGMAVAVVFFATGINSKRYYYLPLGLVIAVVSFLPYALNVPLTDRVYGSLGFSLKIAIGLMIMVAGIIDHFMLMRVLKMQPEP